MGGSRHACPWSLHQASAQPRRSATTRLIQCPPRQANRKPLRRPPERSRWKVRHGHTMIASMYARSLGDSELDTSSICSCGLLDKGASLQMGENAGSCIASCTYTPLAPPLSRVMPTTRERTRTRTRARTWARTFTCRRMGQRARACTQTQTHTHNKRVCVCRRVDTSRVDSMSPRSTRCGLFGD